MTIERGERWGQPVSQPRDVCAFTTDADLAKAAADALASGVSLTAEVAEGDVLRSLGLTHPRPVEERHAYPFDLGLARLDGSDPHPFVAHLIASGRGLSGPLVAIMNVPSLGRFRLGPRAHPNDGRLDVTAGRLPLLQRWEARRRALSGSHLPHPDLATSRVDRWETALTKPVPIKLDGTARGRARRIEVTLQPDALTVIA